TRTPARGWRRPLSLLVDPTFRISGPHRRACWRDAEAHGPSSHATGTYPLEGVGRRPCAADDASVRPRRPISRQRCGIRCPGQSHRRLRAARAGSCARWAPPHAALLYGPLPLPARAQPRSLILQADPLPCALPDARGERLLKYRRFGRIGWEVSEISIGTWAMGAEWGAVDDEQSIAALKRALELGVNFFDTADVYGDGRSERLLQRLRKETKTPFHIATKVGRRLDPHVAAGYDRKNLAAFIERSLKNLGVDSLELVQ